MIMSSWVYWFFPIHLIICWYFFTFFKLQGVPDTMLPPVDSPYTYGDPYYVFTTNLAIMWFFMLTYVLVLVYRQCNADIFFLDWEPAAPKSQGGSDKISVWRTIFVANEWVEMQTMRKIDIKMNLICLGFVLLGLGQEYAATQQPQVTNLDYGPTNLVLRFANTTFWWLVLSGGQYFWKFFIYERFFAETQEQLFIDFCTIAKVSILVLDEPFHGYYMHCRSPHQHADGTMAELMDMLHKEEAGLTVDRSLDGGPTDVQSFQIFMSAEWKIAFSKIYANLVRPSSITEMLTMHKKTRTFGQGAARPAGGRKDDPRGAANNGMALLPSDRVLKAWREMSTFLQEFVENNFGKPGLKRVIREPSQFDTFMNIPPDINIPDQPNVFFPDRQFNYTSVLFLGREVELLLFNILTYSVFDMWTQNTCVAILFCYVFDYALVYLRHTFGTAMVSSKTLIDDRFLM
jgi:meckelin